ncbi:hypothetical protein niasHT_040071 [Heterodera trifolii]|uniref:Uncharacterized protein n=1 Tax=Heterodera trifolii TaxID=157864 RepID=A0ABD2J2K1_9BILA
MGNGEAKTGFFVQVQLQQQALHNDQWRRERRARRDADEQLKEQQRQQQKTKRRLIGAAAAGHQCSPVNAIRNDIELSTDSFSDSDALSTTTLDAGILGHRRRREMSPPSLKATPILRHVRRVCQCGVFRVVHAPLSLVEQQAMTRHVLEKLNGTPPYRHNECHCAKSKSDKFIIHFLYILWKIDAFSITHNNDKDYYSIPVTNFQTPNRQGLLPLLAFKDEHRMVERVAYCIKLIGQSSLGTHACLLWPRPFSTQ